MEKTINEVFKNRADKYKKRLAIEKKLNGVWRGASWNEYYDKSRAVGLGLYDLGVRKGDRVSILSDNRLEWLYTDMGTLGIGAVLIPIYLTVPDKEVAYIIENSESKILVVENKTQLEKAIYIKNHYTGLEKIIIIEDLENYPKYNFIMGFNELMSRGKNNSAVFEDLASSVEPEDLATIVYTSGTTGIPKGAMITHKNIMAVIKSLDSVTPKYAADKDQSVPFLPLSHVFERAAGHFYGMYVGITSSYAESINTILQDIQEKKPTIMLAVPRVCEKVYQRILMQVEKQPSWRKDIFYWGHKIGTEISALREAKKNVPMLLDIQYKIAYFLIFKKLAEALGGRVRWMTASGAPTSREIILFFNAAGIQVIEGYGMTECFAPATMSNLADYKIGTVGRPIPGVDIKIAPDGEILVKGDNVFKGYWKMEKETKDAFTEDGYLMSGDIGMFDSDGFLTITDRKKDLIITSGGKNVAPQKIENMFKSDPLFSQFIVIGDQKKFLSALVNINLDTAVEVAKANNISYEKPQELLNNEKFVKIIEEHVSEKNNSLAKYETIKRFQVIKNEFSQEGGELTPSLKVKRKVVHNKYKEIIDSMYEEKI
ncbi:MAG: long-chain fatty acid--CoA ligase [Desulfobacterales bacterium]|nr:long-chain fatty acid--CoA ligase [Desulfobacterales bacterium]MBF0396074.1 long-chain fatty acid--CoA ligase [Desulfobacterales bacterium]